MGGNESKINVASRKIQISFFVGSAITAKYTLEREGLAREGWDIKTDVIAAICSDFSEPFFFFLQLSIQVDVWVAIFDSILNVRVILGS